MIANFTNVTVDVSSLSHSPVSVFVVWIFLFRKQKIENIFKKILKVEILISSSTDGT